MRKPTPPRPPPVQPKVATVLQKRKPPVAPPVYRPQPQPKVLQRKVATARQSPPTQSKPAPVAPPVYRPQPTPAVLQKKAVLPTTVPPVLQPKKTAINPREQFRHDTKRELGTSAPRPAAASSTVGTQNLKTPARAHPGSVVQRQLWFTGDAEPTKPKYVQSRDDVYEEARWYVRSALRDADLVAEKEELDMCVGAIHGRLIKWAGDDEPRAQISVATAVARAAESLVAEPLLVKIAAAVRANHLAEARRREEEEIISRREEQLRLQEAERKRLALLPIAGTDPEWLKEVIIRFVGRVDGVNRFAARVRSVIGQWSFLTGYEYQARVALDLGENLAGIEVPFDATLTPERAGDLQTRNGTMIECKVFAGGEPAEGIMKGFFLQALDYARSRTGVNYLFKNAAEPWARQLLFCASFWGNSPIFLSGVPIAFPIVIGGRNNVPMVKKAKAWYSGALSHVPEPLPEK